MNFHKEPPSRGQNLLAAVEQLGVALEEIYLRHFDSTYTKASWLEYFSKRRNNEVYEQT